MGDFNWKAGLAYADEAMRRNNERKRAYERQDQEMAQQLYAKMLNAGMDVEPPENMGPVFKELANQWRDKLPQMQAKQLDDELRMFEEQEKIKSKYKSPTEIEKKFNLFMKDPELYSLFMAAGADPNRILQQIKLGQDIELNRRELTGEKPLSTSDATALNVPFGTTEAGASGITPQKDLPPKTITDLSEMENSEGLINDIDKMFNKSIGSGYKWVGPKQGRLGTYKETFAGHEMDPGQADFYALEARLKNSVIKQITGAQLGEKEAERIMRELPNRNQPTEVFKSRIEMSKRNIKRLRQITEAKLKRGGYNVPDSATTTTTTSKTQNEGKTAVNPQTGERIIMQNGKWVPVGR